MSSINKEIEKISSAKGVFIRISPYKLRRVANVVRGKEVGYALSVLSHLPHKGARILKKILESAQANAKHNAGYSNKLFIQELLVNEGPHFKKYQPKARGRIFKILKRTSHVSLSLAALSEGVR